MTILKAMLIIASRNENRITTIAVHSMLVGELGFNSISLYKVRQAFNELLSIEAITFHANHYKLNTDHWLFDTYQIASQLNSKDNHNE